MGIVNVPLGDRSYDIKIGTGLLPRLGAECARLGLGARCAIITDTNVARWYGKAAQTALTKAGFTPTLISFPAGETAKSLKTVEQCYNRLAAERLERKSFVVALGGGVVGDLAGFVSATYLRGISFIQVATTLLAQVDSSVGGKVGVNLKAGKNLVGAFYQPRLVLCDLGTLASLPMREFRAGLAEVIKYGIIYDANLFERLERDLPKLLRRDPRTLAAVVARCCEIKAEVVRQDETESGLRAILNFGHTIGHALEAISHYGKYLHGEAIAVGQVAAARLSAQVLGLPLDEVGRIESILRRAGLPTRVKLNAPQGQRLLAAMRLDKKVAGGEIKFVLARRIGAVEFGHQVPLAALEQTLNPQLLTTNMPAVSETIVREYFELHEFLVRQHRKYVGQTRREDDDDIDFFVLNPHPQAPPASLPFVLGTPDLASIERAIVVVKGWHTETFSSSVLTHAPAIFRFVQPRVFQQAARAFGKEGTPLKILVVPALPQVAATRDESIALLQSKGIDAVIPFRTMLADLVDETEVNRNYQKSDLLQIIRILKNYDFFREPQLELFRTKRKKQAQSRSQKGQP